MRVLFVIYCDVGWCAVVVRDFVCACVCCVLCVFSMSVRVNCKRLEWYCVVCVSLLLFFVCAIVV